MTSRRTAVQTLGVALGSAALPLASMRSAFAAEPMKVAFVYDSPIADAGWNYQHNLGHRELEKNLGDQVATKSIENVPESADSERVFRDLAKSGHRLIFDTTFGYMNYIVKAANDHPGTDFEHCTGYKTSKNLGVYSGRFYEGRYLTGIASGALSPFAGPVVDQDGKARVPAGQNMSDDALGQMNYYVEGVAGRLPKG